MDRPPVPAEARLGAVVLCGGESRRMGRSKAWLPFGPETLLERVVRQVQQVTSLVVVVGARDQDLPPLPRDARVVRDPLAGRGPLQGLAAGFAALPESVELVYATAVDSPFLASGWVARLAAVIGEASGAIPEVEGRLHFLNALYRREIALKALSALLRLDRLRLRDLFERLEPKTVPIHDLVDLDPEFRTVANLNSPEEYERALRSASEPRTPEPLDTMSS